MERSRWFAVALALTLLGASPGVWRAGSEGTDTPEHGGGCRKSSPPGQCCHMDKKAGAVHCH